MGEWRTVYLVKLHITGTEEELQEKKEDIVKSLIRDLGVDIDALLKANDHSHGEDPLAHKTIRDLHHVEKAVVQEEFEAMLKEIADLLGDGI